MTRSGITVFLVDDDPGVLKALALLIRVSGHEVRAFSSAQEFLAGHDPSIPGCAVFDVAMPGLDGLELQAGLTSGGIDRPVIFITGAGNIPTSVRAMKAGAVDFLTKPVNHKDLLAAIGRAAEIDEAARQRQSELASVKERMAKLTPREREVLTHVVAGRLNKQIAYDLGIKVHRGRMMGKLEVRTVVDLVRVAELAGIRVRQHGS